MSTIRPLKTCFFFVLRIHMILPRFMFTVTKVQTIVRGYHAWSPNIREKSCHLYASAISFTTTLLSEPSSRIAILLVMYHGLVAVRGLVSLMSTVTTDCLKLHKCSLDVPKHRRCSPGGVKLPCAGTWAKRGGRAYFRSWYISGTLQ